MSATTTAARFVERLEAHLSPVELKKIQRYFKSGEGQYGEGDVFIGVRMGQVFALAEEFEDMPLDQIEELLESPIHEVRAGAVKIMAKQAASRTAFGVPLLVARTAGNEASQALGGKLHRKSPSGSSSHTRW